MADYQKMYIMMVQETEKAINILTEAQKKCEELYISSRETDGQSVACAGNTPEN